MARAWTVVVATLVGCASAPQHEDAKDTAPVEVALPELDPSTCATATPDPQGFVASWRPSGTHDDLAWAIVPILPMLVEGGVDAGLLPSASGALSQQLTAEKDALDVAAACGDDAPCLRDALAAEDVTREAWTTALMDHLDTAWADLHDDAMLPSGAFVHIDDGPPDQRARLAVREGIDILLDRLLSRALGLPGADLAAAVADARGQAEGFVLPFEPRLAVALSALRRDGRDESVRYGLFAETENAAALATLAAADLDTYRFSAIVVPGMGPEEPGVALHVQSIFRADRAAELWKAGVAPVVLTSGGHVHPDRTPWSEAVEMRRYLAETHGIPTDAILVDPYARHTTTNVRNATRILLRAGVPIDMPFVMSTDRLQSGYIASIVPSRAERELGYVPWTELSQLTLTENCVLPTVASMRIDGSDPLDP